MKSKKIIRRDWTTYKKTTQNSIQHNTKQNTDYKNAPRRSAIRPRANPLILDVISEGNTRPRGSDHQHVCDQSEGICGSVQYMVRAVEMDSSNVTYSY